MYFYGSAACTLSGTIETTQQDSEAFRSYADTTTLLTIAAGTVLKTPQTGASYFIYLGSGSCVVEGSITIVDGNGVSHTVEAGTYKAIKADGTTTPLS